MPDTDHNIHPGDYSSVSLLEPEPSSPPSVRRSSRNRNSTISLYDPSTGRSTVRAVSYSGKSLVGKLAVAALMATTQTANHLLHECINGMNPFTNEVDSLPIDIMSSPYALKAKATADPDLPNERVALTGPDSD